MMSDTEIGSDSDGEFYRARHEQRGGSAGSNASPLTGSAYGVPWTKSPSKKRVLTQREKDEAGQRLIRMAEQARLKEDGTQPASLAQEAEEEACLHPDPSRTLDPNDTVLLFDWDDTLFPTWFITEVVIPCVPRNKTNDDAKSDQEALKETPYFNPLRCHADTVVEVLRTARSLGRVGIVTLSQRPWVQSSAEQYFPSLDFRAILKDLEIPIIYARECVRRPMISQAEVEEGVNIFTVAKQNAMLKALKKLYGKSKPWKNVISIGDSIVERDALKEILWCNSSDEEDPHCKTVKLMEDPSVEQLGAELVLLNVWLQSMALHKADFDVMMDDTEETMGKMYEQFCP